MPAFDKRISDFEAANTQVLGISTDSPFSHENWAKTVGISHYPLLSDVQRSVVKAYGVYWPDWNANVRATFILDKQGKVRFVESDGQRDTDKWLEVQEDRRAARADDLDHPVPPDVGDRAQHALVEDDRPRRQRAHARCGKEGRRHEGRRQDQERPAFVRPCRREGGREGAEDVLATDRVRG